MAQWQLVLERKRGKLLMFHQKITVDFEIV
jgi:hypothetical protein